MIRHLAAACAALLVIAGSASAHVVFAEPQTAPNSYYAGFLRVSHGCDGSPTRAVRVEIPAGVDIARPQPKPGWTLEIEHEPLATPVRAEMSMVTERVTAITWRGELPADQFDQFGIMMRLPDRSGPLYFRVTQICAEGMQSWTDIPAPGAAWNSVPHPAPVLTLATPTESAAPRGRH